MKLNDPEIYIELPLTKVKSLEKRELYEIKEYTSKDYYCVDGFPKEGHTCVIVLNAPMRE
jgi:hypothetical protein